jgi:hypothetical protein
MERYPNQRKQAQRRLERNVRTLALLELADEPRTHTSIDGQRRDGEASPASRFPQFRRKRVGPGQWAAHLWKMSIDAPNLNPFM